jgi:hypothetical protein
MRSILVMGSALGIALSGCAQYQYVTVRSEPPAAEVYLDKQLVGSTPLRLKVGRSEAHAVYVKRSGYRPELVVLESLRADDGLAFLTPPDVHVRLTPGAESGDQQHDLEIEVDPDQSKGE